MQLLFSNSQLEQLGERDRSVAKVTRILSDVFIFCAPQLLVSKKTNSSPMISLIDRTNPAASDTAKPCMVQTLGRRNSKRVRFTQSPPGLFTLLHKATNCPWSDDHTFVQRLAAHWGGQSEYWLHR